MNGTPFLSSLQFRLTASIGAVVAVLVLLLGSYWVAREEQVQGAALQLHADTMSRLAEHGLAEPVWNLDQSAIGNLLDALMTDPQVQAVELIADGVQASELRRERAAGVAPAFWRELEIRHSARPGGAEQVLGRARLGFNRDLLDAAVVQARMFVASLLAVVLLAVVLTSYWLVRRLVLDPVRQLGDLARQVAAGALGATRDTGRTDELGVLTRQFNDMSQHLQLAASELRQSEARNRAELEALVDERTLELEAARRRAEQASEAKSRFLATVSHEFRTPLNAILGFSQLLRGEASIDPQHRRQIDLIHQGGQHLLVLIEDLLDSASIEAGRIQLELRPTALPSLLEAAVETVRARAQAKALALHLRLDGGQPPLVLADSQRLRQVLLNLLSNAVKFTDQGEIHLRLAWRAGDSGRVGLRLEVEDSGIGIDSAGQRRLFRRFEQLGDAGRRAGGTGLGLSISQDLVRLMGGLIEVASEPGRGSRFWFEIELARAPAA